MVVGRRANFENLDGSRSLQNRTRTKGRIETEYAMQRADLNIGRETSFVCNICLAEPTGQTVVGFCGHLFCWTCLRYWIEMTIFSRPACPVCKRPISRDHVVPIFGQNLMQLSDAHGNAAEIPPPSNYTLNVRWLEKVYTVMTVGLSQYGFFKRETVPSSEPDGEDRRLVSANGVIRTRNRPQTTGGRPSPRGPMSYVNRKLIFFFLVVVLVIWLVFILYSNFFE